MNSQLRIKIIDIRKHQSTSEITTRISFRREIVSWETCHDWQITGGYELYLFFIFFVNILYVSSFTQVKETDIFFKWNLIDIWFCPNSKTINKNHTKETSKHVFKCNLSKVYFKMLSCRFSIIPLTNNCRCFVTNSKVFLLFHEHIVIFCRLKLFHR